MLWYTYTDKNISFWNVGRKYLWQDIPEDNNKLLSRSSDISKLETSTSTVIFKIDSHISLSQKNNSKLSACSETAILIKMKKSQRETYN